MHADKQHELCANEDEDTRSQLGELYRKRNLPNILLQELLDLLLTRVCHATCRQPQALGSGLVGLLS
jgi:hypothetical protein